MCSAAFVTTNGVSEECWEIGDKTVLFKWWYADGRLVVREDTWDFFILSVIKIRNFKSNVKVVLIVLKM